MSRYQLLGPVGLICDPAHEVFARVAARLERRGFRVEFFEPGRRLDTETIDGLGLLANKKVDPESFRALRYAAQRGITTWNGYTTVILGSRLIGMTALEAVGFQVPKTSLQRPDGDYVAKLLFDWHDEPDPELNGEGAIYQELLPAAPFDDKYYAVDTGTGIDIRVLRSTSKLYGSKEPLGLVDPEPTVAAKLHRLMALTGSQAIGVDIVHSNGEPYAVDVNPAMSFRHAGMEAELADSMAARIESRAEHTTDRRTTIGTTTQE
jgi:glutathione synthase/RimK-type ligase-like ATP-grasp enzyme